MGTSDIISLILAVLTLFGIIVALILGVKAIRESRNLQKAQYREELLNGILNWLSDVVELRVRYNIATLSQARDEGMSGAHSARISQVLSAGNLSNDWMSLSNRGQILRMSFPDKQKPIPKSISILIKEMRKLSDLHRKYRLAFLNLPDDMDKVVDLRIKLNETEEIQQKSIRKTRETITNEVAKLKYTKAFS